MPDEGLDEKKEIFAYEDSDKTDRNRIDHPDNEDAQEIGTKSAWDETQPRARHELVTLGDIVEVGQDITADKDAHHEGAHLVIGDGRL